MWIIVILLCMLKEILLIKENIFVCISIAAKVFL